MEPSKETLSTTNLRPVIFSEEGQLKINPLNDPNNPLFYKVLDKVLEERFSSTRKGEALYLPEGELLNDFLKKIAQVFEGMITQENLDVNAFSFVGHSPLKLIKDVFSRNNFFTLEKQKNDASRLIKLQDRDVSLDLEDSNLLVIIDKFFGGKEKISPEEQEIFYQILREYFTGKRGDLDLQTLGINDENFYESLKQSLNKEPQDLIKDPRMLIILNYSFFAYRDWIAERRLRTQQIKKPERPHKTPLTERIKKAINEKKALELYQRIKGINISTFSSDYDLEQLLNELKALGFDNIDHLEQYLINKGLLRKEK